MNQIAAVAMIPAIGADGSLHPIEKMAAHRQGILHQAVSVFLFCGGKMLLQRRAAGKYHCGGQWANSVCSHPHWGESHPEAASRRLREELGIEMDLQSGVRLIYQADVGHGLTEHEEVQLFAGYAEEESLAFAPDPAEVQDLRWATPDRLRSEVRRRPEDFAPWFRIYLMRWDELGWSV
jgi:isopentenyl-diphosphate delta-isomerase